MDVEAIQQVASLGVGGAIAVVVMSFYRKDMKQSAEFWKLQSEMLVSVVKENTASNTKMVSLLDALHRRLDADEASR